MFEGLKNMADIGKLMGQAREMQAKAVALIGAFKSYELRVADSNVRDFSDLGVYNVRKLFSQDSSPELELQREEELQRE